MIFLISLLSILVLCLGTFSYFSFRRIQQLVIQQEQLAEELELCLDKLNDSYMDIDKAAGHDVISDDIFTRKVIASLFAARDAVHHVAIVLSQFGTDENVE